MKKGTFLKILTLVLALCSVVCFAVGCGEPPHTHVYDQKIATDAFIATEATCSSKAKYYYSCACGAKESLTFEYGDFKDHDYNILKHDKENHWYECVCGDKSGIENHAYNTLKKSDTEHWYECACGTYETKENHKGGTATCTERAICEVCGNEYGDLKDHDYNILKHDQENHWYECQCGEVSDKSTHELEGNNCTVCPHKAVSVGLSYFLLANDTYEVSVGNCVDKDIIIPQTYKGKAVTSIAENGFYGCRSLISIEIPNSIIHIGDFAFAQSKLRSITMSYNITSINERVFYNCSLLTSIEIPNSVTSIGAGAFSGCDSLTSIEIPNSVTSIGVRAFESCSSLTSIEIPNSVTSISSYLFSSCNLLTNIEIPNSVNSVGDDAFSGCSSLTSIEIPNSVTSVGERAFAQCVSLTSIEIPNSVTSINTSVFEGCNSLTSIEIPNSVTSIGERAFIGCNSLTSMEIPNSVTSIGNAVFNGCTLLEEIEVGAENKYYRSIDGNLYNKEATTLLQYAKGKKDTSFLIPNSVTSIGEGAFIGCNSLTSIEIPNSVTSIGEIAFAQCVSLTSIEIPNSVTSIGNAVFNGCTLLEEIEVGAENKYYRSIDGNLYNKEATTLLQYAKGKKDTSFSIPNSVTSIGEGAFSGCRTLESIEIPNSVTSIGAEAFADCISLNGVIEIPDSVISMGAMAFFRCNLLKSIHCRTSTSPSGWDLFWNVKDYSYSKHNVVWGWR